MNPTGHSSNRRAERRAGRQSFQNGRRTDRRSVPGLATPRRRQSADRRHRWPQRIAGQPTCRPTSRSPHRGGRRGPGSGPGPGSPGRRYSHRPRPWPTPRRPSRLPMASAPSIPSPRPESRQRRVPLVVLQVTTGMPDRPDRAGRYRRLRYRPARRGQSPRRPPAAICRPLSRQAVWPAPASVRSSGLGGGRVAGDIPRPEPGERPTARCRWPWSSSTACTPWEARPPPIEAAAGATIADRGPCPFGIRSTVFVLT